MIALREVGDSVTRCACNGMAAIRLAEPAPLFRTYRPCRGQAHRAVAIPALRYACTGLIKYHLSEVNFFSLNFRTYNTLPPSLTM